MRNFGDRDRSGGDRKKWDEEVTYHDVGKKGRSHRLVGPVQDLAFYWVVPKAADYASEVRAARKKARSRGKEFKPPRRPPAFPVFCPRFDLDREIFVDYRDPETGEGWKASEVLTAKDLKRAGVKVPRDASADARFAKRSVDLGKAIELAYIYDPLHEDFNEKASRRTYWHSIDRKSQQRRRGSDYVGVLNKGGIPYTAYKHVERISDAMGVDPADPDEGWDITFTKDTNEPPANMWSAIQTKKTPLTKSERKYVFGQYKLGDGSVVGYDRIIELRSEAEYDARKKPKNKAAKLLAKIKIIREAAIFPLDEMAKEHYMTGEELKETLIRCGYYDDNGDPLPELVTEDERKSKKKWSDDDDDDDDDEYEDEEEDEDEDEEDPPRRRKKSKGKSSGKKRRSTLIDDDDDEPRRKKKRKSKDETSKRRKKKTRASKSKRTAAEKKRKRSRDDDPPKKTKKRRRK